MNKFFLEKMILGNSLANYILAILFLSLIFLIIKIFDKFILKGIDSFIEKISNSFALLIKEIIKKRIYPLFYLLSFYIVFLHLKTSNQISQFINLVLMFLTVIFTVLAILDLISYSIQKYWSKKMQSEEQQKILSITLFIVKGFIWIIALLFILDNLNIQIKGLITGLGVGGVAIAFAAQNILSDLFNYFTIFFDKPFAIGDFIITGDYRGTIEHIGLKTTRIRSLSGEQLIIANTDLVNSRINNYQRMEQRRINFSFGLTYNTSLVNLKRIPLIVEDIINSVEKTKFDRAHFAEYATSSLIFQVVYYVKASDYKIYMDIQQEINFKLKEKFEELGINFAFPTQTIYLENENKLANN